MLYTYAISTVSESVLTVLANSITQFHTFAFLANTNEMSTSLFTLIAEPNLDIILISLITLLSVSLIALAFKNRMLSKENNQLHECNSSLELTIRNYKYGISTVQDKNRDLYENIRQINRDKEVEKKIYENLLEEKEKLISLVVHELKSPMARIHALTDILELTSDLSNEQLNICDSIKKAIEGSNSTIHEILNMYATENEEKTPLSLSTFDLNELLNEVKFDLQQWAAKKNIRIQIFNTSEDISFIETERNSLKRILTNLVSNAIKFSPASAKVTLKIVDEGNRFSIQVTDEGPGIPLSEQNQLFKKFTKLSPRPTNGESSHGVGLYIVKLLSNRIDGQIHVKSTENEGSTFSCRLEKHVKRDNINQADLFSLQSY